MGKPRKISRAWGRERDGNRWGKAEAGKAEKTFEAYDSRQHHLKIIVTYAFLFEYYLSIMTHVTNGVNGTNGPSTSSKLLWKHANPESTPMYNFMKYVNKTYSLSLKTYPELHEWSIQSIDQFWQSVWSFVGIRAEGDPSPVCSHGTVSIYKVLTKFRLLTPKLPCFLVQCSSRKRV